MCLVLKFDSIVNKNNDIHVWWPVSAAVKLHAHDKLCQVSKFVSIIRKNNDVPFIVNKRLFDGAQISALLYGC